MEDKAKVRMIRGLILFTGVVCLGVIYSREVVQLIKSFFAMLSPFLVGGAMAFVLNLPMRFIENKILKRWKNPKTTGLKRGISVLLSILFVIAILAFVVLMVVPRLITTLMELRTVGPAFFKRIVALLEELVVKYPELNDYIAALEDLSVNWNSIIGYLTNFLKDGVANILSATVGLVGSIATLIFDGVIALVFAIYILTGKENLARQIRKLMQAYLSEKWYGRVTKVLSLCNHNFAKFISGQCLEAVILGMMFVVAMSIFRMPYAVLVGVLIAFTALIPIVGAFIGCVVGALLILMTSPVKAIGFVILFLVLQQIEGNLIYPRVVGNSVGLPAIWVLFAVSVGGSMFGVVGMLVFIPLMSTLYTLLRENVNLRVGAGGNNGITARATVPKPTVVLDPMVVPEQATVSPKATAKKKAKAKVKRK